VSFEGINPNPRKYGDLELCFGTRPGKCLHITHEESIATNLGLIVPQTGQRTDHSTMSTASKVADVLQKGTAVFLAASSLDGRRIGVMGWWTIKSANERALNEVRGMNGEEDQFVEFGS